MYVCVLKVHAHYVKQTAQLSWISREKHDINIKVKAEKCSSQSHCMQPLWFLCHCKEQCEHVTSQQKMSKHQSVELLSTNQWNFWAPVSGTFEHQSVELLSTSQWNFWAPISGTSEHQSVELLSTMQPTEDCDWCVCSAVVIYTLLYSGVLWGGVGSVWSSLNFPFPCSSFYSAKTERSF